MEEEVARVEGAVKAAYQVVYSWTATLGFVSLVMGSKS